MPTNGYLGVGGDFAAKTCKVTKVYPGSAAAKAGFKVNDVITKFGGQRIRRFEDLVFMCRHTPPGSNVAVEVLRNGKTLTIRVVLGEPARRTRG